MTEANPEENPPGADSATAVTEAPKRAKPAPEPWTPERVVSWNSYYDMYVVSAVLILIFLSASIKIMDPATWVYLKSGQEILSKKAFVTKDPFSYTRQGLPWYNVSWLFDVASAGVYNFASKLAPVDAPERPAVEVQDKAAEQKPAPVEQETAEQWVQARSWPFLRLCACWPLWLS